MLPCFLCTLYAFAALHGFEDPMSRSIAPLLYESRYCEGIVTIQGRESWFKIFKCVARLQQATEGEFWRADITSPIIVDQARSSASKQVQPEHACNIHLPHCTLPTVVTQQHCRQPKHENAPIFSAFIHLLSARLSLAIRGWDMSMHGVVSGSVDA